MNKRFIFLMSLSLLVLGVLSLFLLSTKTKVEAQQIENPFDSINNKAKLGKSGNTTANNELLTNVFRISGFDTQLVGFTANTMKDRIIRSESKYRVGNSQGIAEIQIVRTVNGLAKKLDLPEFAKTDLYEVRKLRMSLLADFPQLVMTNNMQTSTFADPNLKMSPTEATFILLMLLRQKLNNPEYQVTSKERLDSWNAKHNHRALKNNNAEVNEKRSQQLSKAINQGGMKLSASELTQLPTLALNTLGIDE